MSTTFTSVLVAVALRSAAACDPWCGLLLPPQCDQTASEGGCCGEDGFRSTDGTCADCEPQGSSRDFMCALCNTDSKCNARNRAEAVEAECEAMGCRGGCLVNGECTYTISQESCTLERKTWCQACPIATFNFCFAWADCYSVCTGCCASESFGCPESPYQMITKGACSPCQNRPEMCEACFPETICSAEYDATKYNFTVMKKMAESRATSSTTSSRAEISTTTTTSTTTTASTSTGVVGTESKWIYEMNETGDEEHMSTSRRAAMTSLSSLLFVGLLVRL